MKAAPSPDTTGSRCWISLPSLIFSVLPRSCRPLWRVFAHKIIRIYSYVGEDEMRAPLSITGNTRKDIVAVFAYGHYKTIDS